MTQNTEFESRHKSMQAEADEHYRFLVAMQKSDPDFDRMLLENHRRKKEVESLLSGSDNWKMIASKLSSNSMH